MKKTVICLTIFSLLTAPSAGVLAVDEPMLIDKSGSTTANQGPVSDWAAADHQTERTTDKPNNLPTDNPVTEGQTNQPEVTSAEAASQKAEGQNDEKNMDENTPEKTGPNFEAQKPTPNKFQLETDPLTGALVYAYPLAVPPSRLGLTPDLKLIYNSQDKDQGSVFGYGWSVNIPYIERQNKRGQEKLYIENYFYSSLSGELRPIAGSADQYGAKVDSGEFLKYQLIDNYWVVTNKQGKTYKFGQTAAARQDNPTDPVKIYKWLLEEERDLNGNYIKYEYHKDAGQIYPAKIKYTNYGDNDGAFEINFKYSSEENPNYYKYGPSLYKAGFDTKTRYQDNISVEINFGGKIIKRYNIYYPYSSGSSGNNRHLAPNAFSQGGADENNTGWIDLPLDHFYYQQNGSPNAGWSEENSYTVPELFSSTSQSSGYFDFGARLADVNGDGLPDIIKSAGYLYPPGAFDVRKVYINQGNGTGWSEDENYIIPEWFGTSTIGENYAIFNSNNNYGVQLAEVNGDGLVDIIRSDGGIKKVYLNQGDGTGWAEKPNYILPPEDLNTHSGDKGVRVVDINGDGLDDFVRSYECYPTLPQREPDCVLDDPASQHYAIKKVYLNQGDGTGWALAPDYVFPLWIYFGAQSELVHNSATQLADVNGDGLVDIISSAESPSRNGIFLNQGDGTGWSATADYPGPPESFYQGNGDNSATTQIADANGDGLVDFIYSLRDSYGNITSRVWVNTGTDWSLSSGYALPLGFNSPSGDSVDVRFADVNGDGSVDMVRSSSASWCCSGSELVQKVYLNKGNFVDLLDKISFGTSAESTITYKGSKQYRNGEADLNPTLPIIMPTVNQINANDGSGNIASTAYEYSGGERYFNNYFDTGFAGFNLVKQTKDAGITTKTYYHQGNATDSANGEYADDQSKIGRVYRTEIYDNADHFYSKTINQWKNYDLGSDRDFVYLAQSIDSDYDGDADHRDKAVSYSYEAVYGNLKQKILWGEVAGQDNGSFTDIGNDSVITNIDYASNPVFYLVGLLSQEILTDKTGNKVKETRYYYDNLALGSASLGNLTKEERWKSGTGYIDWEKVYNGYGLVSQEKDPRDKATTYGYDSYNLYPATVTNPLGQANNYLYDYSSGRVKKVTDPNGGVQETVFDGLDRPVSQKQSDPANPSSLVVKTEYQYTDTTSLRLIQQTDYLGDSKNVSTYTYFDGYYRPVQTRQTSEIDNQYAVKDFSYNLLGQIAVETLPYFSTRWDQTPMTSDSSLYTSYSYDPLQRVTAVANVAGATTNAYNHWNQTTTDPSGNAKDFSHDAYNNLIKVVEHNGAEAYTTKYNYNLLGNLIKLTDALGNVRNFSYDRLGNLISSQDLHGPSDATFGAYSFTYDNSLNLVRKIDPKGQTVNYAYDDLSRILTENYTGQAGVEVSYGYDACLNGLGRLCSVATAAATTNYTYYPLGQIKSESKIISSAVFNTGYEYDLQDNLAKITLPDSSEIKYEYNSGGLLEKVSQKPSGGTQFTDLLSKTDYSPADQPVYQEFSNGVKSAYTYDAGKLYRLSNKQTANSGGVKLQDLSYTYDPVGNITKLVDASATNAAKTIDFQYDQLYRLTRAAVTSAANRANYTQTYSYNTIGNLLTKSDVGSYSYNGNQGVNYANPHAATSVNGVNYLYDKNGNLLSDKQWIHTWDYNNRLTKSVKGATTIQYSYDYDGSRVKYVAGGVTTLYPNQYYSQTSAGVKTKQVFAGSQLIATIVGDSISTSMYYIHVDHLGGTSVVADKDGKLAQLMDYYPFGDIRVNEREMSFDEQRKFTGYEHDGETDLEYARARYYKANIGKFISADPLAREYPEKVLIDPQQLNTYSYARNNPLVLVDLTGEETKIYIEKGNTKDDAEAWVGHSFVEITRDDKSTVYTWGPLHGHDYSNEEYGMDLGITDSSSFFKQEGKNADKYTVYTFDTSVDQENNIQKFYSQLAAKNTAADPADRLDFQTIRYNCTDAVVDAMKAEGIVDSSFSSNTFVSTPQGLNQKLQNKFRFQNTKWYSPGRWLNLRNLYNAIQSKHVLIPIINKQTIQTHEE